MSTPAENVVICEPGLERRFYSRVAPSAPTRVASAGDNLGMALNVSENGLLVVTPQPLTRNFVARISLPLRGAGAAIEVHARAVWMGDPNHIGMQFLDLCDHDREQIRKWVELEEARGLARAEPHAHELPSAEANGVSEPGDTAESERSMAGRDRLNRNGPELLAKNRGRQALALQTPRLIIAAAALAGLVMLGTALLMRGNSFRGWFANSLVAAMGDALAMRPGGEIADKSAAHANVSQPTTLAPTNPATVAAGLPPAAPPESKTSVVAGSAVTKPTTEKKTTRMADAKPPVKARRDSQPKGLIVRRAAANEKLRAAILARTDAWTPASKNAGIEKEIASAATTFAAAQAGAGGNIANGNDKADSKASMANPAAPRQETEHRSSAISGSILDTANANRLSDAAASNMTAEPNAPTISSTSGSSHEAQPLAPGTTARANPGLQSNSDAMQQIAASRVVELLLPNSPRATFFKVPGEQTLQSQAVTVHVQRSILAPAASAGGNATRKEKVEVGELLLQAEPQAPRAKSDVGGRVTVRAMLGRDGHVASVMPLNGPAALVSSAVHAVREWRFLPTLLEGRPVETAAYVTLDFHPEASANEPQADAWQRD